MMIKYISIVVLVLLASGCASESVSRNIDRRSLVLNRGRYYNDYTIVKNGTYAKFKLIGGYSVVRLNDMGRDDNLGFNKYDCYVGIVNGCQYYLSTPLWEGGMVCVLSDEAPANLIASITDRQVTIKFVDSLDRLAVDQKYILASLSDCDIIAEFHGNDIFKRDLLYEYNYSQPYNTGSQRDGVLNSDYYINEARLHYKSNLFRKVESIIDQRILETSNLTFIFKPDKKLLVIVNNLKYSLFLITVPLDIITFPFQVLGAYRSPYH